MAEELQLRVNDKVWTVAVPPDTPLLYATGVRMREYPMTPARVKASLSRG